MLVTCSNPKCCERRVHHERTYENRPQQMVKVADDWSGPYMFCSLTCAIVAGKFHLRHGWISDQEGKAHDDVWEY